jgi:hypothetical protein
MQHDKLNTHKCICRGERENIQFSQTRSIWSITEALSYVLCPTPKANTGRPCKGEWKLRVLNNLKVIYITFNYDLDTNKCLIKTDNDKGCTSIEICSFKTQHHVIRTLICWTLICWTFLIKEFQSWTLSQICYHWCSVYLLLVQLYMYLTSLTVNLLYVIHQKRNYDNGSMYWYRRAGV